MSDLFRPNVLADLVILITGASSGIGRAAALYCAKAGAKGVILFARSGDKLEEISKEITATTARKTTVLTRSVDIQKSTDVYGAINSVLADVPQIDVLINNAGLALGAPAAFPDLKLKEIDQMVDTNLKGMLYITHAVLNTASSSVPSMFARKTGTIINITSTTALEVPPFPGECIYHTTKASQEAFTNSLRVELQGTNIQVLAIRPGVVADTPFHKQRVGFDKDQYNDFMAGFQPLASEDVAEQIIWVLASTRRGRKERVTVAALNLVPSAQRQLCSIDKSWNERNGIGNTRMEDS